MQLPNDVFVTFKLGNAQIELGELVLRVAIRRQRTVYAGDDAQWLPLGSDDSGDRSNRIA